jgi:hypothetical protein
MKENKNGMNFYKEYLIKNQFLKEINFYGKQFQK